MNNNISLRSLKDTIKDYQSLYKWCQDKEVYTYFEQRKLSMPEIVSKYKPRTNPNTKTPVYIIEYQNIPIGLIQYTVISSSIKQKYHLPKENTAYEIDIFIGESKYRNKGIGKIAIKSLINILASHKVIFVLVPEIKNKRAISCYQKVGFTKTITYQDYDTLNKNIQDKVVMVYTIKE